MVVNQEKIQLSDLDLSYLCFFLGRRVNELVVETMKNSGSGNVRESHGYVIQHFIESDRSITELGQRMGVTQQAASKAVAELIGLGILEALPGADKRSKRIRLSEVGRGLVKASRDARKKIEKKIEKAIGKNQFENTKQTILRCLEVVGGTKSIQQRRISIPE